jgi:hypothetical protein
MSTALDPTVTQGGGHPEGHGTGQSRRVLGLPSLVLRANAGRRAGPGVTAKFGGRSRLCRGVRAG